MPIANQEAGAYWSPAWFPLRVTNHHVQVRSRAALGESRQRHHAMLKRAHQELWHVIAEPERRLDALIASSRDAEISGGMLP